tara:strand:+ start:502 stop:990 length:489 start_codon:yes stop_codon:yes gene_type:complete
MSWEDILKNATREAKQFIEEYLSSYDTWLEECEKIHQQQLEQVEEGHQSIIDIKEKYAEQLDIPVIRDMLERTAETNNRTRQSIYESMDRIKELTDRMKALREEMVGVPIYNILETLIMSIPPESLMEGDRSYPNSPSYDLQQAEDLLHRLSFEGSGRRDFT